MKTFINKEAETILNLNLPKYNDIPNTGLYLEQVTKYINGYLENLPNVYITPSMVTNYVKQGLLPKCEKKQYSREQIMRLILITFGKTVLSMDDLKLLFKLQSLAYPNEVAYNYFLLEYENVIKYIFGINEQMETIGTTNTLEKELLRNAIISFAHKMYVELTLDAKRKELLQED
ncbi:MAG: DUF1836 domain-containing protein [Erysipelotrichales bacterium]|nr:DUF1836 domain-containing protein [Erysipelotrichales bacterium]